MNIIDLIKLLSKKSQVKIIGVRPGEKIHEELLTLEESSKAKQFNTYYLVNNSFKTNNKTFDYRSDNFLMDKKEEKKLYKAKYEDRLSKQQIDVLIESIQFRLYLLSKDKGEYKK